jgi:hypothetical protein
MVAERIYLESLRAQVHAELKVHVADEEIRLALEGRMNAIRDFYKRKATASQLKDGGEQGSIKEIPSFSSNPKCSSKPRKPKILSDMSVESPRTPLTDVSSLSCLQGEKPKEHNDPTVENLSTANQIDMPFSMINSQTAFASSAIKGSTSTSNNQKLAYERAQANIQVALEAANLSMNQSGVSNSKGVEDASEEEEEFMKRLSAQVDIPPNIDSSDTSYFDEEEVTPVFAKSEIDVALPSIRDAWSFYRQINNLMSDNRVYDYEFRTIQKDQLYPYLDSLTGIADSGDDGTPATDKKVKQPMRDEFRNKSPHRICHILAKEAKEVQPELIELCEDIARRLNMQTMAVGKPTMISFEYVIFCFDLSHIFCQALPRPLLLH